MAPSSHGICDTGWKRQGLEGAAVVPDTASTCSMSLQHFPEHDGFENASVPGLWFLLHNL